MAALPGAVRAVFATSTLVMRLRLLLVVLVLWKPVFASSQRADTIFPTTVGPESFSTLVSCFSTTRGSGATSCLLFRCYRSSFRRRLSLSLCRRLPDAAASFLVDGRRLGFASISFSATFLSFSGFGLALAVRNSIQVQLCRAP